MSLNKWIVIGAAVMLPCATAAARDQNQWMASGFVGSNFANNAQPASMNFGGSLAYLWRSSYGAELDTGFTPNFQLQNNFLGLGVKPQVDSYMANAVFAKPLGPDGRFQPFVSGGAGAINLRSGITPFALATPNDTRFGADIGGGLMAFSGNWGFKADVRYLRATGTYNTTGSATAPPGATPGPAPIAPYGTTSSVTGAGPAAASTSTPAVIMPPTTGTSLAGAALSGLHFWRANVGLAVRW